MSKSLKWLIWFVLFLVMLLAVDQLELSVPRGSVFGFLGPNGAGKTTTIRMLLGLIKPSDGRYCYFTVEVYMGNEVIPYYN